MLASHSSQNLMHSIIAGVISACFFVGAPFSVLSIFILLPLAYIGLSKGVRDFMIACASALVVITSLSQVLFAIMYGLMLALPFGYLLNHALKCADHVLSSPQRVPEKIEHDDWYPVELLLLQLLLICLVVMTITFILMSNKLDMEIIDQFYKNLQTYLQLNHITLDLSMTDMVRAFKIMPALVGISFFIMHTVNCAIAQRILKFQHKNLRPGFNVANLELPQWLWLALVGFGILSTLFHASIIGDFSLNVTLVLLTAFMIQGISVFYVFIEGRSQQNLWVTGFYLLMLVFPWTFAVTMAIGIFEPWSKLRYRIRKNLRN